MARHAWHRPINVTFSRNRKNRRIVWSGPNRQERVSAFGYRAVRIIARMPALMASGSRGHASTTAAKSGSRSGSLAPSAPDSAPPVSEMSDFPAESWGRSSPAGDCLNALQGKGNRRARAPSGNCADRPQAAMKHSAVSFQSPRCHRQDVERAHGELLRRNSRVAWRAPPADGDPSSSSVPASSISDPLDAR